MKALKRLASFVTGEHRYVFLGTSVIAALGLMFSQQAPTPLSVLARTGVFQDVLWVFLWAWLVVSAVALVTKLAMWRTYAERSPFAKPGARKAARIGSYVAVASALLFFLDRAVLGFAALVQVSIAAGSNPTDFLPSLVYMTSRRRA